MSGSLRYMAGKFQIMFKKRGAYTVTISGAEAKVDMQGDVPEHYITDMSQKCHLHGEYLTVVKATIKFNNTECWRRIFFKRKDTLV